MQRHLFIWLLAAFTLVGSPLAAQNATSSPSSRFGFGELNDNIPTQYRALGGVSAGMRTAVINPSQPASYTVCDSTTFMFDLAGSVMWTNYGDNNGQRNRANGNLEYITLQFPIWKRYIAFSAGIMPYSSVGYDFSVNGAAGEHTYKVSYQGEGGFSQVYAGLGFNILNWVALGANFYYMFGDATNTTLLEFDEADITGAAMFKNMEVGNFRFRYGAQLFHTFAQKHEVVLGAVYEHKKRMTGEYLQYELSTLDSLAETSDGFQTPAYYSVGASYRYDNRLLVAFDYSCQQWSSALYFGEKNQFADRSRISLGVEYRHNPLSRNYAARMFWRVGASLASSYLPYASQKDLAVSLGIGLPFRTTASMLNLTVEYNRRHPMSAMVENNLKLTIGVGISEHWFFKRRL